MDWKFWVTRLVVMAIIGLGLRIFNDTIIIIGYKTLLFTTMGYMVAFVTIEKIILKLEKEKAVRKNKIGG